MKLRGYRIETGEIEAALRRLPELRDAAVVLLADGATEPRLVAYPVPREPMDEGETPDWRDRLRGWLPDYMLPAQFVVLERLPVTPNGKLDRRALPVPAAPAGRTRTAPSGPTQQAVAAIWAEVLGHASFGADDDFFALGGHSLMATRVLTRVRAPRRRAGAAQLLPGAHRGRARACGRRRGRQRGQGHHRT
ncbi:hypothetical protein FSC37_09535 [Piscinibacter aquaticus]|uniref:Carrier domain-containing protein n=1 Tax=Piscinibacter aquaticus TaxID=392597 RepID=A0A5C6U037_9BURK|nr:hypothetical protein FSC37_09535 [Piscinibacter aquaticus]